MYIQSRVYQIGRNRERDIIAGAYRDKCDEELIAAFPKENVRQVNSIFFCVEKFSARVFILYVLRSKTISDISEELCLDGHVIRRILRHRYVDLRRREGKGW